jgi:integrase/recombinase XerD
MAGPASSSSRSATRRSSATRARWRPAPKLEGLYLDEVTKLIGDIVVKWRPRDADGAAGKKHPIIARSPPSSATSPRCQSVMDYCVDEGWRDDNPVLAWLKPGGRRKSRLKERRDPIVLPEPPHRHGDRPRARAQGRHDHRRLKTGARSTSW